MKIETCATCKKWNSSFCGQDQNVEGLCKMIKNVTYHDYFCEYHKLKLSMIIIRLYYKIRRFFILNIEDPLKKCKKAKAGKCVHVDGYLCPCEDMNENK